MDETCVRHQQAVVPEDDGQVGVRQTASYWFPVATRDHWTCHRWILDFKCHEPLHHPGLGSVSNPGGWWIATDPITTFPVKAQFREFQATWTQTSN